jgi:tungstate transport system substrate-binding protein
MIGLVACGGGNDTEIILGTTTSTYDSSLLDVLIPDFESRTGYVVKPIAVGSGKAIEMGRRGEVDVLLVHAPDAELGLLIDGTAVSRSLVMHNYFVIAGPSDDPANVNGALTLVDAMAAIAGSESLFISRGDSSGTHMMEQNLWDTAELSPAGGWYQESGQGMGATLQIASQKGAYTLSDRGTFLSLLRTLHLTAMVGAMPELLNEYSVLQLNPDRFPKANTAGGGAFAEYLLSQEAQTIVREFGLDKYDEPLFIPGTPDSVSVDGETTK